ncbi:hypothetical protein [Vulcanisaeta distributa]|uniref:hypothetical protein n=1 Tax=Vulcanisaeta distributa TaxID=164451 RepID=UPI001FB34030|nr:hypothetical protein [Vulcanisaeta distributa]
MREVRVKAYGGKRVRSKVRKVYGYVLRFALILKRELSKVFLVWINFHLRVLRLLT